MRCVRYLRFSWTVMRCEFRIDSRIFEMRDVGYFAAAHTTQRAFIPSRQSAGHHHPWTPHPPTPSPCPNAQVCRPAALDCGTNICRGDSGGLRDAAAVWRGRWVVRGRFCGWRSGCIRSRWLFCRGGSLGRGTGWCRWGGWWWIPGEGVSEGVWFYWMGRD